MRLGLNGATIMHTDVVTELEIADEVGFELVELRDTKLRPYLERRSMSELLDFIKTLGVTPVNINALEEVTFVSEKDRDELARRTEWFCSTSAQLGCKTVPVVPGKKPAGVSAEDCFQESVNALKRIAPYAAHYGVGLSFEFIGFKDFTIRTLSECRRVIEAANEAVSDVRIGMVFDFIHYFAGQNTLADLELIDPAMIDIVHLCDAADLSLEAHQEGDGKRVLPGDGIIKTSDLLKSLASMGYDGDYSIEIFNQAIWDMHPLQVAGDAYAKAQRMLGEVYSK